MQKLNTNHGSLHKGILSKIQLTFERAIEEHPRTLAIRIDLRLPNQNLAIGSQDQVDSPCGFSDLDASVISRFFSSLKAKIKADLNKKTTQGKRVHRNTLRYLWVKEYGGEGKPHYHVLILLNKDNYAFLGSYQTLHGNLASMIQKAWMSAMRVEDEVYRHLVHFPESPVYYLNINSPIDYERVYSELLYRASYLAKEQTKLFCKESRSFGCSQ